MFETSHVSASRAIRTIPQRLAAVSGATTPRVGAQLPYLVIKNDADTTHIAPRFSPERWGG